MRLRRQMFFAVDPQTELLFRREVQPPAQKTKDRELDALTNDVTRKLVERATVDSELAPSYVDLVFVARALERIGDHGTNIAEDSFWRDQATDIRHTYGPKKED